MKLKDKKLQKRLAKYGFLAAAIVSGNEVEAAVIYTDEAPDFTGGIGSQYFLDLNNDAINDFRIWHNGFSGLYISPLAATNGVLGSASGSFFAYPFALTNGAVISSGAGSFFNNGFSSGYQSMNYGSCSYGNWCSITDGYLGLRFDIAGSLHYGWARLDVDAAGNVWTVKDYAYDDVAGASILAGDQGVVPTPADMSTLIVGTDIAENSNGLDLQVDFTAAANEATIGEYRIMAVKSLAAPTFDLTTAEAVLPADYTAVLPTGAPTYTEILTGTSTDTDGDPIVIGEPYRIFVLNIADGVTATVNSLSEAAADVTLNTTADIAPAIVGSDVANNLDGSDLQVNYSAALNEAGIYEYRVIAVKTGSVATFDLTAALALPPTAYMPMLPTGGPNSVIFNPTTTDSDADPILNGQPYTIFVLSVADTVQANISNMASSAADITLTNDAGIDENILAAISAFSNGNELMIEIPDELLSSKVSVSLVTSQGQIVATRELSAVKTKINTEGIVSGVYFVKFSNEKGSMRTIKMFL